MGRSISHLELRDASDDVLLALDRGESFIVLRNGIPVAELVPLPRRRFVGKDAALQTVLGDAWIDPVRFRNDVDRSLDQDPEPRG